MVDHVEINLLYRPSQTIAQCWLDEGESIVAEAGAMMGMSSNVQMRTHAGGALAGAKRLLGGESFFRNTFTAQEGEGEVLLTTPLTGDMFVAEVGEQQWNIAQQSFVASAPEVVLHPFATARGFMAGAGPLMFGTRGRGTLVLSGFGAVEAVTVDGSMVIDTGHLVAWDAALQFEIERSSPAGWLASWLSGEGLVCRFRGRGTALVQSRNPDEYGRVVGRLLSSGGGA